MQDFLSHLLSQARAEAVTVDARLDDALARLDHMLEGLAGALQVEVFGPHVGVETPAAHQLVIRAHAWRLGPSSWSLKVCSTAPQAGFRAEWSVQGAGRLRKQRIVKALPQLFADYAAAVSAAGRGDSPAGRRVLELARRFNAP